jgi:hypothetical protein
LPLVAAASEDREPGGDVRSRPDGLGEGDGAGAEELVGSRRETSESQLDARVETLAAVSAFGRVSLDPEQESFSRLIDDQVVAAIDALLEERTSWPPDQPALRRDLRRNQRGV